MREIPSGSDQSIRLEELSRTRIFPGWVMAPLTLATLNGSRQGERHGYRLPDLTNLLLNRAQGIVAYIQIR